MIFRWLTERRRKHLLEQPFPDTWPAILEQNVGVYALLDDAERKHLRDLVQVFVAEKHWEGAGGLELTDEIRVTIAGTGCQLLLGRDHELFKRLVTIVVYPSTMIEPPRQIGMFSFPRGQIGPTPIEGLATPMGAVLLAWDNALRGARNPTDGRNTVVHELAHEIDMLDGTTDGTPPLATDRALRRWGHAFEAAFLAHKARAARGEPSLLRDYAITNEAEYFAVATEVFFEQPRDLLETLPDVYAELRDFYGLDLASRTPQ